LFVGLKQIIRSSDLMLPQSGQLPKHVKAQIKQTNC